MNGLFRKKFKQRDGGGGGVEDEDISFSKKKTTTVNLKFSLISKGSRQEHCTDQVTITLMMTLLPDRVTFIFPSRESYIPL